MKKYAILFFQQINDLYSKWVFPLHEGENIIGSDKDVDIFLFLDEKEDIIDTVHCKVIMNEKDQNKTSIISLATRGSVKMGEGMGGTLLPGKVYELHNKKEFYLTDNIKFMLVKGTINEIHKFLLISNLEEEFQKWHQKIMDGENKAKLKLGLVRKDSSFLNRSIISNNGENNFGNNNNLSATKRNKSFNLSNSKSNINFNNNNNTNKIVDPKEVAKRLSFNNFDDFPEAFNNNDLILSRNNSETGNFNNNNNSNNIAPFSIGNNDILLISKDNELDKSTNKITGVTSCNKKHLRNDGCDMSDIDLYVNNFNKRKKRKYKEKEFYKDDNTRQQINGFFGDNDLENIIKNTDYNRVISYDKFYKDNNKKEKGSVINLCDSIFNKNNNLK